MFSLTGLAAGLLPDSRWSFRSSHLPSLSPLILLGQRLSPSVLVGRRGVGKTERQTPGQWAQLTRWYWAGL